MSILTDIATVLKGLPTLHFVWAPNLKLFWTTFVEKLMNHVKSISIPIGPFRFCPFRFSDASTGNQKSKKPKWQCSQYLGLKSTCV